MTIDRYPSNGFRVPNGFQIGYKRDRRVKSGVAILRSCPDAPSD